MNEKILLFLIASVTSYNLTKAFSPSNSVRIQHPTGRLSITRQQKLKYNPIISTSSTTTGVTKRFSSQWDDEEDEAVATSRSFDQAGEDLKKEEDEDKMSASSNADENPNVSFIYFVQRKIYCIKI